MRIDGGAHGGEIDEQRHAGEILEDDAGDDEGDFIITGSLGVVVGEVGDVLFRDFQTVVIAEKGFENDPDRDRKFAEIGETLFGKGGERVEISLGAGAGGEGAECVHGWIVVEKGGRMSRRLVKAGELSKSFSLKVKLISGIEWGKGLWLVSSHAKRFLGNHGGGLRVLGGFLCGYR